VASFRTVDLHTRPAAGFPVAGTLIYGQGCPLWGRDTQSGWWLVACPDGVTGWVAHENVSIVGDPQAVPWFSVASLSAPPPALSSPAGEAWRGTYYANADLQGTPVLVQVTPALALDWGFGSPAPSVPPDYFSARYLRDVVLPTGSYQLTLGMDGGARLWLDDELVLDDWRSGAWREQIATRTLGGEVQVRVEYFAAGGPAAISFALEPANIALPSSSATAPDAAPDTQAAPMASPPPPEVQDPPAADTWRVQYFNNTGLGGSPAVVRDEPRGVFPLDRNWGSAPPVEGIGPHFWSARFVGRFYFTGGDYTVAAAADDGVRVYIDDRLALDAWYRGRNERRSPSTSLNPGWHTVRVEYFAAHDALENAVGLTAGSTAVADAMDDARVRVWWTLAHNPEPLVGPIPPPVP
jgi:hypothetical protein